MYACWPERKISQTVSDIFSSLGLLVDGQVNMAKGMVTHFVFEIKHYNKVGIMVCRFIEHPHRV